MKVSRREDGLGSHSDEERLLATFACESKALLLDDPPERIEDIDSLIIPG